MKKNVFYAVVFVCILTLAFEIQATTVLIDPETQGSPPAGGMITIGVKIETVSDLFAYQFELLFDNTALKFSAIEEEDFLGADGTITFPFLALDGQMVGFQDVTPEIALAVNSTGALTVANTRLGSDKGINGTAILVNITFEVLEAKASALKLQNIVLADSDALPITADVINGDITPAVNVPPVAEAGDEQIAAVGKTVTFDGSASRDEDGNIVSYSWSFGDGNNATGVTVSHIYNAANVYEVTLTVTDDDGDTNVDTTTVKVLEQFIPVIREHSPGSPMLALQAVYNEANVHGHIYIDIWGGNIPIAEGQFLEFQMTMFSGNTAFSGTVDLHTSDGSTLGSMANANDQNGVNAHPSADLSEYARDQWYHRKISLDALAGKTLDGVMIATSSDEHRAGLFRVYVDNIQITDGENILTAIYLGEDIIPITGTSTSTEMTSGDTEGMSDYSVSIVGETPVTPRGKLVSLWGGIKSGR